MSEMKPVSNKAIRTAILLVALVVITLVLLSKIHG
jgi:hypothetical protein